VNYRRFGATDLVVSELGVGCARIGGVFLGTSTADAVHLLHAAFDAGITFYDTADMYSQGDSERIVGRAIRGRRDSVVIATKVGYVIPARRRLVHGLRPLLKPVARRLGVRRQPVGSRIVGVASQDFSADYVVRATEQCLRRLQTDYLDLLQLHSPPASILASGDVFEPLVRLQRQGKIRYFGVACETLDDALIYLRNPQVSSIQISVNLLGQRGVAEVLGRAQGRGAGVIGRQCFASGLLAKPAPEWPREEPGGASARQGEPSLALGQYRAIADELQRPLLQLALGYAISQPGVAVTLLGLRTEAHLHANLRHFAALPLAEHERKALAAAAAAR
jgi:aryl-alcohol dehydrogenase-like predicted oxidoreductase